MKSEFKPGGEVLHAGARRIDLRTIRPDERELNASCSYYSVAVGDHLTPHYHSVKTEVWFVVSGSAVVRLGDERTEVSAGTAIITPPGVVHGVERVLGDRPLVFANIATPPNPDGPNRYAGTVEVE